MKKDNLSKQEKVSLAIDFVHRTFMHEAMWFNEVRHQFGREKAYDIMNSAWKRSSSIQLKRIAKLFDFELVNGLPKPLLDLDDKKLDEVLKSFGVNWLANDGVWFQSLEFTKGMNDAKRVNDSCWGQFSPFEAQTIKEKLNLGQNSGLEGLKKALKLRLYAYVNKQSFIDESENSFIFQMNECRVQIARNRKGMQDYPCKSGGLVEYTTFAENIDSRIKTQLISCPPDPHPTDYYCAWRFYIE